MSPSLVPFPVTEHLTKSSRHSSFHFACGPAAGQGMSSALPGA